ncbi:MULTISPECIES: 2-phosphosulfolactate phosphatase [Thermoanaerobacterium]|uniref:Probable 2-phosphosulfolactate phosphatase n=3 Tax=Thermoanaerobacterium TaxID=28895 RepID=W9EFG2_9THEO|nr:MULTISPECIES: 2-phosphosulfolactate phosphatase [Thermoanaerobacterium]AFK85533.1 2-phosphosulfolactate phosphatase [Thermoanaerobacterium saccharolyticum JW/SL-YS485]ETO39750.1 2-phosphosulfolactate phosphatase [Thermoanaerobacterium aotearoense SCUT27]
MSRVITTAFTNRAKEVIPVAEIEDAVRLAKYLGRNNILLCGERNGAKIEGFDLSNSHFEYKVDVVKKLWKEMQKFTTLK